MRKEKAKKLLREELAKTPIISVACKKVGVSRQSFYRWSSKDPSFRKTMMVAILDGEKLINDMTESQLLRLIQDGNFSAVRYWLDRRHPLFRTNKKKTRAEEQSTHQHVQEIHIVRPTTGETEIIELD